jgi:hypothetical protein
MDKKALRKSFFASVARLIGVALGAGTGSLIHQLVGGGVNGWGIATVMAIVSFVLIWIAEYERESE